MNKSTGNILLSAALLIWVAESAAQIVFEKARLEFSNGTALIVELADAPATQARGLMNRMHLGEDEGMLFIFPNERRMIFWMKSTYIPLSIGFLDNDRRLMSILDMEAQAVMASPQNLRKYISEKPGRYALEVNQGWFERNGVTKGMTFELFDIGPNRSPTIRSLHQY